MPDISGQPIIGGQTTAQNEAVETVLKHLQEDGTLVPPHQRDPDEWDEDKKSLFIEDGSSRIRILTGQIWIRFILKQFA
jgi:hypothetical protein